MCKVSVILPVRNGERFLGEAIESILSQTMQDFELLLLNDGSVDKTQQIIDGYQTKDPRIKGLHFQPRGLIATLNDGISMARADLIARMDADDIAMKDRFEKQIRFLSNNLNIAVLGTQRQRIDQKGTPLRSGRYPCAAETLRAVFRDGGNGLDHPTVMYRKQAVVAAGAYREPFRHAEDRDLWLRILDHADVANLDAVLLHHRWHDGNVSIYGRFDQLFNIDFADMCGDVRLAGGEDPALLMRDGFDLDAIRQPDVRQSVQALCDLHAVFRKYEQDGWLRPELSEPQLIAALAIVMAGRGPARGKRGAKFCQAILASALEADMPQAARLAFNASRRQSGKQHFRYVLKNPVRALRVLAQS